MTNLHIIRNYNWKTTALGAYSQAFFNGVLSPHDVEFSWKPNAVENLHYTPEFHWAESTFQFKSELQSLNRAKNSLF